MAANAPAAAAFFNTVRREKAFAAFCVLWLEISAMVCFFTMCSPRCSAKFGWLLYRFSDSASLAAFLQLQPAV
jgi:hypothetical protein